MAKTHNLQDPFLNLLRKDHVPVNVYLVNGIKLTGQIEAFDQFVIVLKNATIPPAARFHRPAGDSGDTKVCKTSDDVVAWRIRHYSCGGW